MQIDANDEKQENVFENDGCRAKRMFVLPTMCEMGLLLWIVGIPIGHLSL